MAPLRRKSLLLTGYLEWLLTEALGDRISIVTPREPNRRGCQISLRVTSDSYSGPDLFPHLSAAHNVALLARHLGWDETRVTARLDELADLARFPVDCFDRFPAQLSSGERQRVSLMRALMLDPDVLLLDEPLGSLDPIVRSELQSDLRDIFRTLNKTVVLVTHDMGEAGFFGHVIVLMRQGRIVQQGTLSQLINEPADDFVERFIRAQGTTLHVLEEGGGS